MALSRSRIETAVNAAHAACASLSGGKNADYIPFLASVPSHLFGLAVVTAEGEVITAGDALMASPSNPSRKCSRSRW